MAQRARPPQMHPAAQPATGTATGSGAPEPPSQGSARTIPPPKSEETREDELRPTAPAAMRPAQPRQRTDYVKLFEYVVTRLLIVLMAFVIVLAVIDLVWVLVQDLRSPPFALLDISELLDVFGLFLLVLIGIELLETLKAYVRDRVIRAEVVILVAMIALARKIITLDVTEMASASLLGIAAIVIALGLTFFLIRRPHPHDEARPPEGA